MRGRVTTAAALFFVAIALLYQLGCSNNNSSPVSPTPPPSGGGGNGATLITILGIRGNQSFTPNPASVSSGGSVDFTNTDSTTHHIVADNGSFDTGNLVPGSTSAAMMINSGGTVTYHCTIHPSMVGSINGSTPPGGGPGY